VQQPGPPVIMGGSGRARSAQLAAEYAAEYNVAFAPREKITDAFRGGRGSLRRNQWAHGSDAVLGSANRLLWTR
jgi:alkanesulfonate monooxygenase SsuD/methylene tetrahydromethanopterin reductase-like flavin-dependent oxidoreductase (luciferase family)